MTHYLHGGDIHSNQTEQTTTTFFFLYSGLEKYLCWWLSICSLFIINNWNKKTSSEHLRNGIFLSKNNSNERHLEWMDILIVKHNTVWYCMKFVLIEAKVLDIIVPIKSEKSLIFYNKKFESLFFLVFNCFCRGRKRCFEINFHRISFTFFRIRKTFDISHRSLLLSDVFRIEVGYNVCVHIKEIVPHMLRVVWYYKLIRKSILFINLSSNYTRVYICTRTY
jgi:hypothetical protein